MVTAHPERLKQLDFWIKGCCRHGPEVYKVSWYLHGVTLIGLSPPLARILHRPLMFLRECPRLVLHKRRAKYGGDGLMRRVNLDKISTIELRF